MLDLGKSSLLCFCWMGSIFRNFIHHINLKPSEDYLLKRLPDFFVKIGHGMIDIVIYCTEPKFQHA